MKRIVLALIAVNMAASAMAVELEKVDLAALGKMELPAVSVTEMRVEKMTQAKGEPILSCAEDLYHDPTCPVNVVDSFQAAVDICGKTSETVLTCARDLYHYPNCPVNVVDSFKAAIEICKVNRTKGGPKLAPRGLISGEKRSERGGSYTCHAYCGYYATGFGNGEVSVIWSDTEGRIVAASGSSRGAAFNKMFDTCKNINSKYLLYGDSSRSSWATPSSSCYSD